jgi:multiple sugar transport system substrate-binding protein
MLAAATAAVFSMQVLAADRIVRVWHTETEPQTIKAFNDIVRRFEAKNPGVKIEAEGLAWGDLEGKIMAALASGNPPELSHGQPITCTALQSKGLLLPLDDVVKAIGEANIWEQVRRVCNVGGKQYGVVHAAGTSLLIYRRDVADKQGLKPPKTWADLIQAAKALTLDTNGDGRTDTMASAFPATICSSTSSWASSSRRTAVSCSTRTISRC